MTLKILSVDWDYFFPCIDGYDWSHGENDSIFFNLVWQYRAFSHRFGEWEEDAPVAYDTVKASQDQLKLFETTLRQYKHLTKIFACESHASIWEMMTWLREQIKVDFNVWNLDAHHDYWYGSGEPCDNAKEPTCANWAFYGKERGLIRNYHLIYPEWREGNPEPGGIERATDLVDSLSFGLCNANLPKGIDLLFICRSSAWTPPWEDARWMELLETVEDCFPYEWQRKDYSEYVLSPRSFDYEEVLSQHLTMTEAMRQHYEENS